MKLKYIILHIEYQHNNKFFSFYTSSIYHLHKLPKIYIFAAHFKTLVNYGREKEDFRERRAR